jgi:hypothetical protein
MLCGALKHPVERGLGTLFSEFEVAEQSRNKSYAAPRKFPNTSPEESRSLVSPALMRGKQETGGGDGSWAYCVLRSLVGD